MPSRITSRISWSILINQILKIYYLARVNLKNFKALKNIPNSHKNIPRGHLYFSNVYSPAEMILLKWSEVSNLAISQSTKRLTNFDSDFKTGWIYSAIIQFFSDRSIKP